MTESNGAAYATDAMKRAGVGFREHTGWAAMVALGGGVTAPVVLARSRYELSEGDLPRAVYHAARQLDLENAGRLVQQVGLVARTAAEWGIDYETYWLPADEKDAAVRLLPDGLPTTFLVGPRGVTRYDRLLKDEELERLVLPLLGGPPPAERPE